MKADKIEVKTFFTEKEDDQLITDGDATLSLVRDLDLVGDGCFGFCLSDGGGFSGLIVTLEAWAQMKIKVDSFILKNFPEKSTDCIKQNLYKVFGTEDISKGSLNFNEIRGLKEQSTKPKKNKPKATRAIKKRPR